MAAGKHPGSGRFRSSAAWTAPATTSGQLTAWEKGLLVVGLLAGHALALWVAGHQVAAIRLGDLSLPAAVARTVAPVFALVGIGVALAAFWRAG